MAIFDGHNDLLLNLWLHHREDPVSAFFAGIENGHLDYPRIRQGGLAGGLFALFVPPQEYITRVAPQYASQAWDPRAILWQQLAILKTICAHDASRARLASWAQIVLRIANCCQRIARGSHAWLAYCGATRVIYSCGGTKRANRPPASPPWRIRG